MQLSYASEAATSLTSFADVSLVHSSGNRLEPADSETVLQTQISEVEDTVDTALASSCVPDLLTIEAFPVSVSVVDSTLIAPDLQKTVEVLSDLEFVTTAVVSDSAAQQTTGEKVIVSSTDTQVTSENSFAGQCVADQQEVTEWIVSSPIETVTDQSKGKRQPICLCI